MTRLCTSRPTAPAVTFSNRQGLSALNGAIELAHGFRGPALDQRASDVAEVTGLLRAREHIQDDGFVGPQCAGPTLMRIAALPSAGHDGVGGQPAGLEDGGVDNRPQLFRSERIAVVNQTAFSVRFARTQSLDAFCQADFSHHQGGADFFHFLGRLDCAFGEKQAAPGLHADFHLLQFARQPKREKMRDKDFLHAASREGFRG